MNNLPKSDSRPWNSWFDMIRRCERPYVSTYKHYGGRGIQVCDRWHVFSNFWEDMGADYKDNLTLERIDNDGNYESSNCRWVTQREQCYNRRSTRHITIDGQTRSLAEWINDSGLKSSTVRQRFYVYKWDIKRALGMEVS